MSNGVNQSAFKDGAYYAGSIFFPENDYVDHTIKKGYWNPERKLG